MRLSSASAAALLARIKRVIAGGLSRKGEETHAPMTVRIATPARRWASHKSGSTNVGAAPLSG